MHVCFLCVRGFGIVHRCLYSDYHEKKMIFFIFFLFYDTLRDYACQLGIMRTGSLQASTQLTVILSFVLSVTVGLSFTEAKRMVSTSGWTPAQWGPHPENRGNWPVRHGERTGGSGPQAVRQQGEAGGHQRSRGRESLRLCYHACGAAHCQRTTGSKSWRWMDIISPGMKENSRLNHRWLTQLIETRSHSCSQHSLLKHLWISVSHYMNDEHTLLITHKLRFL